MKKKTINCQVVPTTGLFNLHKRSDNRNKPKVKLVYDEKLKLMVNQDDKSYGVTTNEKSFKRGVKASNHVSNEVKELCHVWLCLLLAEN